ncbi:required for drug-induced death protein 1-like [Limanda limanda]|uniref:required for drug-induced death protein 1-like n=1 Tax=Limanda limanda TaxID=27771 RepID=UPI0029C8E449|nr:required for drug-induced death protein 1-like [Limanda limanda]
MATGCVVYLLCVQENRAGLVPQILLLSLSRSQVRSLCLEPGADSRRRSRAEEERGMGQQEEKKKEEEEGAASPLGKKQKSSKEVYFSVLPDKYEPLIEEEERETPEERRKRKEEKKKKKKRKYKKYRKNLGKGLRFSWSCLLIGLQSMASVYTTPASAVSTVVTVVTSGSGRRHDGTAK